MADTNKFVNACRYNNVSVVRQMLDRGQDVNARDRTGFPGLYLAMWHNHTDCVAALLGTRNIMLDSTYSYSEWTGLHIACYHNSVESVRLFLAHPACTKQVVTMLDKEGKTAEMIASSKGYQDCVRIIKEFLDKEKSLIERLTKGNVFCVEPVRLEGLTLVQIGDAIEKITAIEQTLDEGKNTLEVEHQKEIDELQAKHAEEKTLFENFCTEKKNQKQILQAELQQRLQAAQPAPPASLIPECPICMESMKPPLQIFTCSNGHLICSICRPKVNMNKCHCEALYVGRATAMEQMISRYLVFCRGEEHSFV